LAAETGRLPPRNRRPDDRSDLGRRRAPRRAGLHSHRRSGRVLRRTGLHERTLARARALPEPALPAGPLPELRATRARARQPVPAPSEHDVRDCSSRLAGQRPRHARPPARRTAKRVHGGRRGPLRHRQAATHRARLLHPLPGPHPVRQGLLPARRVSVFLARIRNGRRLLRLLPAVSRVLEAVRHRPAGRGAAEAVLRERAADHAGAAAHERRYGRLMRFAAPGAVKSAESPPATATARLTAPRAVKSAESPAATATARLTAPGAVKSAESHRATATARLTAPGAVKSAESPAATATARLT